VLFAVILLHVVFLKLVEAEKETVEGYV